MPRVLQTAVQYAVGRSGVSVVAPPRRTSPPARRPSAAEEHALVTSRPTVRPGDEKIDRLARMVNAAERVTLFCGRGCAGAHEEVMAFAELLKAPVGHALRGKEWIQYDNPYDVGMSGLLGYGAAYEATHECDLLILLGTDFPYGAFLPADVRTVAGGRPRRASGPPLQAGPGRVGDVRETLRCLTPKVHPKTDRRFLDRMLRKHADALEGVVKAYTRRVDRHIRSTRSTWPRCWTRRPPTTRSSPWTPGCATCGRPAICPPTAAAG
ncbi:hypothetical protein TPA0910_00120 [Streptomyces hygroscopicus subsp. sporocinereus]|uniref:Thiamine pyrophosphate enzyme central domain-containing protein n=1 Tax=Streptomyces hygroscopicus TaxID=1912 RepID=A0ABQ3TQG8_STRHY|nr:hypothetical protein TPA0910_00120 [Streptomyces hygroscopicus]